MYTVRSGNIFDISDIINLVKELAIFEKEPNAVTATEEDYKNQYKLGLFKFNVVLFKNKIVGMALYYDTFSTWKGKMTYLEDFVITQSHRSKGAGQLLFDSIIEAAKSEGSVLLKWQVLDWNEGAIQFYNRNNAHIETDWHNGKIFL